MKRLLPCLLLSAALIGALSVQAAQGDKLISKDNLVAWCIVPFDAKKRSPQERAAMLQKLGIHKFVYDYRAEHIPTFDAEMEALKAHNIELVGWWFPQALNDEARTILNVIKRHNMTKCDLWVMGGGAPTQNAEEQMQRVESEAARLKPIALEAAKLGVRVGLYNHGAWFGEPGNQIEIIERLKKDGITNVGIVYNLHHGHEHLPRFAELMQKMKPYLICLNINGMAKTDTEKRKILPLGAGDEDLSWLKIVRDSGYSGPIGILNHTDEDAEARLQDNLDGLAWLTKQLAGSPPQPRPAWRSFK